MQWRVDVTRTFSRDVRALVGEDAKLLQRIDAKINTIRQNPDAFVEVHYESESDVKVYRERFESYVILFSLELDRRDPPGAIALLRFEKLPLP